MYLNWILADFGVILGSRLYLKELTNRALIDRDGLNGQGPVFQEGDVILKINSTSTEGLSLKDAKKLMENCKDKLQLTIRRASDVVGVNVAAGASLSSSSQQQPNPGMMGAVGGGGPPLPAAYDPTYVGKETSGPGGQGGHLVGGGGGSGVSYDSRPNYCNQNLYVQPPTRGGSVDYRNPLTPQPPLPGGPGGQPPQQQPPPSAYEDNKAGGNLSRLTGRSRGPLMDVSLSQLDHSNSNHHHQMNGHDSEDAPPRPPPPRSEDFYGSRPEPHKPPPT